MVARGRNSASDNHCAIDRSICVRWHGVNQFLASRNIHGTFKQTGLIQENWFALIVKTTLSLRYGRGRCDSPHQGAGPQMILAVLDHALHADNTSADLVDLATPIAVLSTGCRPLGSCSRAAGWRCAGHVQ